MSTQWTAPQQSAIEARGGTLLVSAAAGSGKTAVLVERAVQLLTDAEHPIGADRLLIATFTKAAAEELRGRIAVRLAQEAEANPASVFLRRQRLLLGRAYICTIDAFCMQLLKRYFAELDLPPDFVLADDAQAYALRQAALMEVLEAQYEDADFCAFASLYGRARGDQGAAKALLGLYDFLRSLPHPLVALEQMCISYESHAPLVETAWGQRLLSYGMESIENALGQVKAARSLVAQEPQLEKYDAPLAADQAFFEALLGYLQAARWDDSVRYAASYAPVRMPALRGCEDTQADAVKALRQSAKDALETMQKHVFVCTQVEFLEDRARLAPMLRALSRAVVQFEDCFFTAKLGEKVLEYSDFEHLALKLLCNEAGEKTAIARTVSRGFDVVMVDEYQDTNALQALLYRCLANDDASNLFFVGDVKQSIYRFRLASPEIFISQRRQFAPYEKNGLLPATIVLGHNFRSAGNVIAQINDVFSCLMSETVGNVVYDDSEALVQGVQGDYDGGAMELKIVDTSESGLKASDAGDAQAVASTIVGMVEQGFLVRDKGALRPCRWEDFCILLRGRAKFPQYAAALQQKGVPVFADTGESWLTATEVSPLLSFLRVIDNPGQDVALAAVLLSPMFRFTPDDLLRLRADAPKERLFVSLLQSKDSGCMAFCALLQTLRTLAATLPVDGLCSEIFARTHYFSAVGAMENGAARRENLRSFTAFAGAISASSVGGLAGFLRRVDSAIESGASRGAGVPAPPKGTVAIMTIHRSKGLEFPICILADAAHGFNYIDAYQSVQFHPVLGAGFTLRAGEGSLYATAPHRAIRQMEIAESTSEEMRILYVALTRAKDKLIVSFPHPKPRKLLSDLAVGLVGTGGVSPFVLAQQHSFAAWLCTVALLHPDCDSLRKEAGGMVLPLRATKGRMHAEILRSEQAAPSETAVQTVQFYPTSQPDADLLAALEANFTRVDPQAGLCSLPAKLSVSAISKGAAQPVLARPGFLYTEGLTAAERGTAQHAFLQFADLRAATKNLPAELDRLVQENYLPFVLAEKLPRGRIEAFLKSALAQRMLAAETLLREYDFITAVEAKYVAETDSAHAYVPVLVQGIADAVLVHGKEAEIADYKTDKGKTQQQFIDTYAMQLRLYRRAIEKRLGVTVTRCTIYAFDSSTEIDVKEALENQ